MPKRASPDRGAEKSLGWSSQGAEEGKLAPRNRRDFSSRPGFVVPPDPVELLSAPAEECGKGRHPLKPHLSVRATGLSVDDNLAVGSRASEVAAGVDPVPRVGRIG